MQHPRVIRPEDHAVYAAGKMGKSTLFESSRLLVGLNAFEPGQAHPLHAHAGMDKVYSVVEGEGVFLLEDRELPMRVFNLRMQRIIYVAGSPATCARLEKLMRGENADRQIKD